MSIENESINTCDEAYPVDYDKVQQILKGKTLKNSPQFCEWYATTEIDVYETECGEIDVKEECISEVHFCKFCGLEIIRPN